jgi:ribosomal protein L37AE/L43A
MAAETQTYPCPNCGGSVVYDIARGLFACAQCGSTFAPAAAAPAAPPAEPAAPAAPATPAAPAAPAAPARPARPAEHIGQYRCDSCGADIIAESATGITVRCHYCHNPAVLRPEISGEYAPDAIVPFTIGREEAVASFQRYTARHRFTRPAFYQEANIEKLTGVYLPYFAIDAYLEGDFAAEAEQRDSFSMGDTTVTDHRVFQLLRRTRFFIDDYALEALTQALSATIVNRVKPFDLTKLIPFDYRYLVGFQAERRDLTAEELEGRIRTDFNGIATKLVNKDLRGLGYSSVSGVVTNRLDVTAEERKYCLLPVWLFTYLDEAKGKTYYYAVNGQTGEASGILPVSGLRAGLVAAGIAVGGAAAILGTLWGVG